MLEPIHLHPAQSRPFGRPGPADRPPLPSGHPISWRLITAGTVLHDADYPFPVFFD